jgi:uncharacterized repeat protein (TIGR01451 family)
MRKAPTAAAAIAAVGALAVTAAVAVGASVDLSIEKSDSVDPATVGTEFQYTLAVANAGPEAASNVKVEDRLPAHLDFVAATTSQGACAADGKKVTCDLGTVAGGGTATVTVRVLPLKAGKLTNTATVSSPDADSPQANNSDTERTKVIEGALPECAGQKATIVGTPGADQLHGTKKRDVIVALTGKDAVFGFDGRDLICANGGNDFIKGGDGPDSIRAGGGRDSLGGGPGADNLRGGTGRDHCKGGPGRDQKFSCA